MAIQLQPGGGIASYDVHAKNTVVTNGLGLAAISGRSVLGNASAVTGVPSSIVLPTNSILASTRDGLTPLTAVSANHVLIFDGKDIVWGPIVDHLPNLGAGQMFIGDADGVSTARTITGSISMNPTGMTTLNTGVVTTASISDLSVSNSKIQPGNSRQVLTSGTINSEWSFPQMDVRAVPTTATGPLSILSLVPFPDHVYDLQHVLTENGQSVILQSFGVSATSNVGTVSLGMTLQKVATTDNASVVIPTGNYPWKCVCTLYRITVATGYIEVTATYQSSTSFGVFSLSGIDWSGNLVASIASSVSNAANISSLVCNYSSATVIRPGVIV